MSRQILAFTSLALAVSLAIRAPAAKAVDSATVSGIGLRNIGSAAMSGRIAAIAGRQEADGKVTLFVGAASGGVWKSLDGGTSFKPVFDREPVQSIGAIALDPTNPKTVWVGTGESWTRNSTSIGDGIYKSTDGGETWTNMGLPQSERITRIVVDPKDGNTVYACVPGKLWSDSAERGLYKTSDGGQTWSLILKGGNLSTGCSSVALNPRDPDEILAGMWDFRRKGWTFRSGGDGPQAASSSGLFHSKDGGQSWTAMTDKTSKGLPATPWGRVEVVYAPSKPSRVYAFIENVRSALYVSDNGGATWEERDRSRNMVWRPFYFSRLVVDPTNPDRLFKMNLTLIASEDGGKSFTQAGGGSHGDWHDVWINPSNPRQVIGGDDGGLWLSYDGGVKWWKGANLPISQFYHVSVDEKDPYQVYGGLQDNSVWVGDSAYPGGITNDRWENLYGGDGFFAFPDPADTNFVYAESQGGYVARVNRKTLEGRDIQPKANYHEKLRFNWNTPIALSPNERARSTSARSFCSARAIMARPGSASRPISRPTIRKSRSRKSPAASPSTIPPPRCTRRSTRSPRVPRTSNVIWAGPTTATSRSRATAARPGSTRSAISRGCPRGTGSTGSRPAATIPRPPMSRLTAIPSATWTPTSFARAIMARPGRR